jgi:hypothetical protein
MQKMSQLDERNQKILSDRQSAFLSDSTIKSGDFVRFVDGTLRRVSHVWTDARNKPDSIQTSTGGSFYIGNGYMSFSGGLYSGVDFAQFTRTDETMHGRCWFLTMHEPGEASKSKYFARSGIAPNCPRFTQPTI